MYQSNNLAEMFFKLSKSDRLSYRLPDYTKITTLYYMNRAINCCDNWDNFLDIGAFDGHYSVPLLKKFNTGTAVEIDNNQNLISLKNEFENFTPIIGTLNNIKANIKFDFILMADIFEHIPLKEIKEFCLHTSNLQDVGGVIYILTPNPIFCGPATKSSLFHGINDNKHHGHQKHYLKQEIVNLLSPHNYDLIFSEYEESAFRQFVKKIIYGFSIRDNKFNKSIIYRLISPIFIYPLKFFLYILGSSCHKIELSKSNSKFEMMSQILVFKKI